MKKEKSNNRWKKRKWQMKLFKREERERERKRKRVINKVNRWWCKMESREKEKKGKKKLRTEKESEKNMKIKE